MCGSGVEHGKGVVMPELGACEQIRTAGFFFYVFRITSKNAVM
jgi:hypothetical protein